MPAPTQPTKPASVVPPTKPTPGTDPTFRCIVTDHGDGGLVVAFKIDTLAANRLKLRANGMPLDVYIYENILKPSISAHVF